MARKVTYEEALEIERDLGPNVICVATGRVANARGNNYALEMVLMPTPCSALDRERVIATVLAGANGLW